MHHNCPICFEVNLNDISLTKVMPTFLLVNVVTYILLLLSSYLILQKTSLFCVVDTLYIYTALKRWSGICSKLLKCNNCFYVNFFSRMNFFFISLCKSRAAGFRSNKLLAGMLALFAQNHIVTCRVCGKSLIKRYVYWLIIEIELMKNHYNFCSLNFLLKCLYNTFQIASTPMPQIYLNKMVRNLTVDMYYKHLHQVIRIC